MTITPFSPRDTEEVIEVWNRTLKGHALFYPLTPAKLASLFLEKPNFDPDGFLLARDARGIAGGVLVSARGITQEMPVAEFAGIFDRGGNPGRHAQAVLDAALAYLEARRAGSVRTTDLSSVDSRNVPLLEFLWMNRFSNPGVYDCVIDRQVSGNSLYVACALTKFAIPPAIEALEAALIEKGYVFRFVRDDELLIRAFRTSDIPFSQAFAHILQTRSPLEHLMVALWKREPVGAALASCPGAPTDWPDHGCDCGLFGPTGVARAHRGGIGKVLLFRTLERLQQLNFRKAIIPIAPSILPFYAKAGARIERIMLQMHRPLGVLTLNIR